MYDIVINVTFRRLQFSKLKFSLEYNIFSNLKYVSRVGFFGDVRHVPPHYFSPHKKFIKILAHRLSMIAISVPGISFKMFIAPTIRAVELHKLSSHCPV